MLVGIDESGHNGHSPGVNHVGTIGYLDFFHRSHLDNPLAVDQHRLIVPRRGVGGIDEQTPYNGNRSLRHVGRPLRPLDELLDRYLIENRGSGRLQRLDADAAENNQTGQKGEANGESFPHYY